MPSGVLDHPEISFPKASQLYATFGVRVNALSVDDLFALYERTGFLYPEKAARLRPHLSQVRENWGRMMRAGESLLSVLSAGDDRRGWGSLAVWRTSLHGWVLQHLVSENNPFASRAVMLAYGAASILNGSDESAQNWFRPENRFPGRVFGSMVTAVGSACSSVQRHSYFALRRDVASRFREKFRVVAYDPSHREALCAIAAAVRGNVYVSAEDLSGDVEFEAIDDLYRRVGLRRTRRVWLAFAPRNDRPVGAAIVYRGPLGINFSYLENRCDLLLNGTLSQSDLLDVSRSLLRAAAMAYDDFELSEIPIIADDIATRALVKLGAEFVRHYCQGMCLKDGYTRFYRHIDAFYSKLSARAERHAGQEALVGSEW